MGQWIITGKKYQVDAVDKKLKKDAHIKGERPGDGSKLIIDTKNVGEDRKVIDAVYEEGAKIKK